MLTFKSRVIRTALVLVSSGLIAVLPMGIASAATLNTGQPGVDCADGGVTPGQSALAPGSAFNPDGKSGTVYAGEQPQNSVNPKSVSQYDVACFGSAH